jgi:hypothetical protein
MLLCHRSDLPSTNPKPALSTASLAYRRRFPTADLHHRREPTTVSPSAAYAPNRDPYLRGLLPGTFLPMSRTPVKSGEAPLFRSSGPKGLTGSGRFRRLGPALQQV